MSLISEVALGDEHELESLFERRESIAEEESLSGPTSVILTPSTDNEKKRLCEKGLHSPASGDICNMYISMSDSTIFEHVFNGFPLVINPGIEQALDPEPPKTYSDDGQDLYLKLCQDMNLCPVRIFHKQLLTSEIDLSYYGLDPKGVQAMAKALRYNKTVTCLNLKDNFLDDHSCYHLGELLKHNNKLKELNLEGCRIGPSGLLRVTKNLNTINRGLVLLNLARNKIGDTGGVYFAKVLYEGSTVKEINLSNNQLGRETASALVNGSEWGNYLVRLDLSRNTFFHISSAAAMIERLAESDILQELNLSFNSLKGDKIAQAIFNLLHVHDLKFLDLSHNLFRDEAIDIIISGLTIAKNLVTLNLSGNPMTPVDAYHALQKMLRPKVKLENLLMDNVCVNKSFLKLLAKVTKMKYRHHFKVTYGYVLQNWTVEDPDQRKVILKRAYHICRAKKRWRRRVDIALYFLHLLKEYESISVENLIERLAHDKVRLNTNFVKELSLVFPGPTIGKSSSVDVKAVCEYIGRLWPEKELPPSPLPEPEPVSIPPVILRPKKKQTKSPKHTATKYRTVKNGVA